MNRGFIGLVTIIGVSAVALIIGSTILLKSITEATLSSDEEYSAKAWASVNACGEIALFSLASTSDDGVAKWTIYDTSMQNLSIDGNLCYYTISGGNGTTTPRTINASSTVSDFTRKILIVAATNSPAISLTSWAEVADFQ